MPVVGDFSGPRALAGIGTFLRQHGLTVAVFYASNVEMYLFRGDGWKTFYRNLSSLPIDGRSVLVRSIFPGFGPGYRGGTRTAYGYPGGDRAMLVPGLARPARVSTACSGRIRSNRCSPTSSAAASPATETCSPG